MRTSATGPRSDSARPEAGFTLIELLAATAILAIIALSAVLSLRLAPGETPAARMDELARAVRFLQEEAMYTRRNFALSFAREGWKVLELDGTNGRWQPRADGRPYGAGAWNPGFKAALDIEGRPVVLREREPDEPEPDVMLLSSGESTPFRLKLEDDEGRAAQCRLGAFGELACRRGS